MGLDVVNFVELSTGRIQVDWGGGYLAGELLLHGLDEVDVGEDLLLLLDVLRPRTLDGLGGGRAVEVFLLVLLFLGAAMREREQMRE